MKRICLFAALLIFGVIENRVFGQTNNCQFLEDDCIDACFYGQSALPISASTINGTASMVPAFCGSIENDSWIGFYAGATSATFTVSTVPGSCLNGNGVQIALYEECGQNFLACNVGCSGCAETPQSITVTGLILGNPYYLLIDGWAGDQCDFEFTANPISVFAEPGPPVPVPILRGNVAHDLNFDCLVGPGDEMLAGQIVKLNSVPPRFRATKADGSYEFRVKIPGTYEVSVTPTSPILANCPLKKTVQIGTLPDTTVADFALQGPNCAFLTGFIGVWGNYRPCQQVGLLTRVCNGGDIPVPNPFAEITLDQNLTLVSSMIPIDSISGNTFFFNLDTLLPGACFEFKIMVQTGCDVPLGTVLCNELRISPDTICVLPSNWSGAKLMVDAVCIGDSIGHFTLTNTGNAPFTKPRNYIVTEDLVVIKTGATDLLPGESMTIDQPLKKGFASIRADQETGYPFAKKVVASLLGCGPLPPSSGAILMLPTGDEEPFLDIDCQQVRNSFDPNDKTASPAGFKNEHFIERGDRLDYTIRFQNMGNDTAFRVEIRDDLSENLDITTLRVGLASHPMSWELADLRKLVFKFDPIRLPDSTTNFDASQGFVQFSIAQKSRLKNGTQIFNQAGIYFDHNAPVITNQTFHTIGEKFLIYVIRKTTPDLPEALPVKKLVAGPNPMTDFTVIEWPDAPPGNKIFRLFDLFGNEWLRQEFDGTTLEIERGNLPAGHYFFRMESENSARSGSGQLIID